MNIKRFDFNYMQRRLAQTKQKEERIRRMPKDLRIIREIDPEGLFLKRKVEK